MLNQHQMRTQTKPNCLCCGSTGTYLYVGLQDSFFGTSGIWSLKRCSNKQCGLLWLDPSPITEDIHIAYESYYTHSNNPVEKNSIFSKLLLGYRAYQYQYLVKRTTFSQRVLGKALSFFSFFREHMDYPFVYFKQLQKGKLLELGVGSGESLMLFKNWGWHVEGVDFDPKAVECAASKGLKVHQGDIFSLQFANDLFDAIFSSHVIEHVSDPIALMQESLRVLKPGGIFVAVTPNASSRLHQLFKSNWRGLEPPRHLQVFTTQSLLMAATKAGFDKVDIASSNCSAIHIFYESLKAANFGNSSIYRSLFFKYFVYLVGWFLNIMHHLSPLSGEEIVLIAYKKK